MSLEAVGPARILLIDDEPDSVETLGERLRARGLEVDCAGTGEEGIERAAQSRFDMLIDRSSSAEAPAETLPHASPFSKWGALYRTDQ